MINKRLEQELRDFRQEVILAQADGLCVNCKEPAAPKIYSDAGRREYKISGCCEVCFDEMFKEEE